MRDWSQISFDAVLWILSCLALVILTVPTVVVFITSFKSGESLRFPPSGRSWRWYVELLDSDYLQDMALRSLEVAAAATIFAATLGASAALALSCNQRRWARALDAFFMSPLIVPWIAIDLGILLLTGLAGLPSSIWILIAGHTVVCVPFLLRTTTARLSQIDPALLEASATLGARPR